MEDDENDILFTNTFIRLNDTGSRNSASTRDFEEYYNSLQQPSIDEKRITSTGDQDMRYKRLVKTFISIDSRNRDTEVYPKPSHFKIPLGKSFHNVRTVRLVTIEFPNTNAVVNSSNNKIYWINKEDIDDDVIDTSTKTYPIYNTELRVGSYIATKLEVEMESKFRRVKRRNKTGEYHYILTTLDIETDVVTFVSLIVKQLGINPLTTLAGTGLIQVTAPAHGYVTGETIYVISARVVSGIGSEFTNGAHVITVINQDTFTYEITENAISTDEGGGSNIKTGKLAPFQLLFGEYSGTVAKNIGYLYENSSQQVVVDIKSMDNFFQVLVTTTEDHNLTIASVNTTVVIAASGTTPSINGTRVISNVIDSRTFAINVGTRLAIPSFSQGTVTVGLNTFDLESALNNPVKTILLETFNSHNYTVSDIGDSITFYSTISKPSFDGENRVSMVLSSTQLVIEGEILPLGNVSVLVPGSAGYTPAHQPLTTEYYTISDIVPGTTTRIVLATPHILRAGDSVKLYNVSVAPAMPEQVSVFAVIDQYTFTINHTTTSVVTDISLGESAVGSAILTMYFPRHGFNTITSIVNDVPSVSVLVTTLVAHGYTTGDRMRISKSNTVPSVDAGDYEVTVVTANSFTIPVFFTLTTSGTYGVIGMSMDFILYRVVSFGGFDKRYLNGTKFTVRDVVDGDNFTFMVTGTDFSTSKEKGGGTGLFINSLLHGFNGVQTNTKNGVIDRSISLEGENYAFLVCPQLGTMKNTGDVENIFARITLDQSPGMMVFNFLSNPKEFETATLDKLEELELSMTNYDKVLYEFNDLDYSMTLEITETIDTDYAFNQDSRRGIPDSSNKLH